METAQIARPIQLQLRCTLCAGAKKVPYVAWIGRKIYQIMKAYFNHKQEYEKEPANLPDFGFYLNDHLSLGHDLVAISTCRSDIPSSSGWA